MQILKIKKLMAILKLRQELPEKKKKKDQFFKKTNFQYKSQYT